MDALIPAEKSLRHLVLPWKEIRPHLDTLLAMPVKIGLLAPTNSAIIAADTDEVLHDVHALIRGGRIEGMP